MEAELAVEAPTIKEAMVCSDMMLELVFDESFGNVPLYINHTLALHVNGNRTYSPRAKDIALRYVFVQALVEDDKIGIHYVKTEDQRVYKEIVSLEKHSVFEIIRTSSVLAGHKVVGVRCVFKVKVDSTYKGRLVVLGFLWIPGVDCGGTFAPVCRLQSIRMILAIAEELNNGVYILHVQKVFLKADVEEDVFVKMAPGYETNGEAGDPLVIKLNKILYGFRQSPKKWFSTMDVELVVIGFRPLKPDPCVYIDEDETGFVFLTLYVDDIIFLSASKTLFNKLKKKLVNRFEMSDKADVSRALCMNVTRDRAKGAISPSARKTTRRTWHSATVWMAAIQSTPPE